MFTTSALGANTVGTPEKVDSTPFKELDRPWDATKAWTYVIGKADCKYVDGQVVRLSRWAKIKQVIEGGTGVRRYHKAKCEGLHIEASAAIRAKYEAKQMYPSAKADELDKIVATDAAVRSHHSRVDARRYRAPAKNKADATGRSRFARNLSRMAHHIAGFGELTVAPTSLVLAVSERVFTPKLPSTSGKAFARAFGTLFAAGAAVYFLIWGIGRAVRDVGLHSALRLVVTNYSVFTLSFYGASLLAEGVATLVDDQAELSKDDVKIVNSNADMIVRRIADMVRASIDDPVKRQVLCVALCRKIAPEFCNPGVNGGVPEPKLLTFLYDNINAKTSDEEAHAIVGEILGRYLTQGSLLDEGVTLDLSKPLDDNDRVKSSVNSRSRMTREKHVAAFAQLIDNHALYTEPEATLSHGLLQDARAIIVESAGRLADKVAYKMGSKAARQAIDSDKTPLYKRLDLRGAEMKDPARAHLVKGRLDHILSHHHQYGAFTVGLARVCEGFRILNYSGFLSTNMQVCRPFAWVAAKVRENAPGQLKGHASQAVSWGVGRVISSAIWAVLEVLMILPAGNGVPQANVLNLPSTTTPGTTPTFPLNGGNTNLPFGLSLISTAAHMLVVGILQAPFIALTQLAFQIEGWQGNTRRQYSADRIVGRTAI